MKNKLVWGLFALVLVCAAGATLVLNWQNWFDPAKHNLNGFESGELSLDLGTDEEAYNVKYVIDGEKVELRGDEFSFEKNEGIVFLVTNGGSLKLVNVKADVTEGLANMIVVSNGGSATIVDSEFTFGDGVDGSAVFYTKDDSSKIAIENTSITGDGDFRLPIIYGNGVATLKNVTANLSNSPLAVLKDKADVTLDGGEYTSKWPFTPVDSAQLSVSAAVIFKDGNTTFTANDATITQESYSMLNEEGVTNVFAVFSGIGGSASVNLNNANVAVKSSSVKFAAAVNGGKIAFNNGSFEATNTNVEVGSGSSITGLSD